MVRTEMMVSAALNATSRLSGGLAGAGTYTLFHMPLARSSMRDSERELFGDAHIQRQRVNGKLAATYRWGNGARPVLLVHGWQSRASRLADFVPGLLDRGYSVIAFDAPGHGDATGRSTTILEYRDIIAGLQDEYGEFEAVIAHSLGALGAFFALQGGVKAKRVATISGVCDYDYLIEEFCSTLRLRHPLKARLHQHVAKNLFPGLPADRTPFSAVNTVADLEPPLLIIHDEDDTRISVRQGRRLAAAFGGQARLLITTGLGHRRILGDANVVRSVLDFVEHGPDRSAATDAERAAAP
ncbi:alpha/beta hydrolase [Streptomyces sp. OR43]|uniref:alpha/beta hydrolase n=1 Tax=Streptomyces sp. or43 TaxID=2478957 RepID=UPI001651AD25|nr:alpha/beta hydrolase [Streptomyces sp. or43]